MVKKGKGKGKDDDWEGSEVGVDFSKPVETPALLDGGEPEPEVSDFMAQVMNASKKKQSRKKRKDEDFEAAISENLAGDEVPEDTEAASEPAETKGKGKKGKNAKKGGKNAEEDAAEPEPQEAAPEPEEEDAGQKGGKGAKGKKNKKNKEDEFWADIEKIQKGELEPEEKPEPKGKQQQQQQQQQQKPQAQQAAQKQQQPAKQQQQQPAKQQEPEEDGEEKEGQPMSAAALKRKEKKERQKQQQENPAPAPTPAASKNAPPAAAAASSAAAASGKKNNSPAAAIKLMQQKQREEEERLRKIEEEAQRKWQEEEDRRLAEEREKEELKQKKKEKERQKIEELKKQGKYMTKAEKEKQAQLEERRAKLALQGIALPAGSTEENKPKKVVYGKRKKPQPGKQDQGQPQAEAEAEGEVEGEAEVEEQTQAESAISTPQQSEEAPESWESWEDIDVPVKAPEPVAKAPAAKATSSSKAPAAAPTAIASLAKQKQDQPTPQKAQSQAKTAPAKKQEEESEDESSEEEDSDDEDDDSDDSEDDEESSKKLSEEKRKEQARERRLARHKEALANRNKDDLRSPICCILGHVDTGKTKLLDKIRHTNVQENEAGGITQQIGATYFPGEIIREKIAPLNLTSFEVKVPGLLVIDTPGHESFTNLRSRGSSLCNIAILVIDIMHYLEPQTIESLNLLRQRKTPFIVALNKIDRIYSWQPHPNMGFEETLSKQSDAVKREFEDRLSKTLLALAEQGLNAELYTRNQDFRKYVSICPTSAITGEGIPDMIMLLVQLTQKHMSEQLMYLTELEATVLEVKVIEGQGTTIDVVLSNGVLREGDRIAVCGMNGPILTNVRALLTPQPLRELRVKSQYVHHKEVKAALGVKISAPGLEKAVAGSRLMVVGPDDDEDEISEEIMSDLADLLKSLDKSGKGVSVQASTLGSLEALLAFLRQMKIPVFNINIGPVHKKDVMRASIMLEHQKEYATMLCFDVEVEKEAQKMADELGVRIFTAEIIYHLFDQFTKYITDIQEQRKKDLAPAAVFPCVLKIVPGCIFNKRSPILIGVTVVEGNLRIGTPLCVPVRNQVFIGKCTSIEINHKAVEMAKKGQDVAIRIELPTYETPKMVGRHFEATDDIVSQISRESINILKETFREEVSKEEWALIVKLKKVIGII